MGRDLPWMITETLVIHVMIAIATATLFLFQMATLNVSMSVVLEKWSWVGKMEDVHANNKQEGGADKAHVGNGLENTTKIFSSKTRTLRTTSSMVMALGK